MCFLKCLLLGSAEPKEALKSGLSDMEYLRSKVASTEETMEEEGGEEEEEEEDERTPGVQADSAYESGDRDSLPKPAVTPGGEKKPQRGKKAKQEVNTRTLLHTHVVPSLHLPSPDPRPPVVQTEPATDFTVKLRGAPFTVKEVSAGAPF